VSTEAIERATAPARWLLDMGVEGIALTQTHALARVVVREGAERWPQWWDAELFGPPHREADVRVLEELREGLRRLGLVRRRGRQLFSTKRGRGLAQDPQALLEVLAGDLGGDDEFTGVVAAAIADALATGERTHDDLAEAAAAAARRGRWANADGRPPSPRDLLWDVSEVLCRGAAYGLIERRHDDEEPRWRSLLALTDAGAQVLATTRPGPVGGAALIFDAELLNAPGVSARLAVGAEQHLTVLHDAIREAFRWVDDHLYSFWLNGRFWGDSAHEFTSPIEPDGRAATADLPIAELGLEPGAVIAYLFDFGDQWRVLLTLRERSEADGGTYPRVVERVGSAPPQHGERPEGHVP
jgi:Plasmid pRiA4b ORF-3-like protein